MIPKQVIDAVKTHKPAPKTEDSAIRIGDIRSIQDFDGGANRIGLILNVDNFLDFAVVTLIHPYTKYATEHDVVIDSETVSLPYDIVAQCDIRASVWKKQIGELVGHLSATSANELMNAKIDLDNVSVLSYFGSKLTGPFDVRWNFKAAEGRELKKISQDCTTALIENNISLQVDDLELMTAILRAEHNYEEMLLCLLDLGEMHGENVRISENTWVKLEDLGLLDENRWKDNGFDVERVGAVIYKFHFRSISTRRKDNEKRSAARSANTPEVHITLEKLMQESLARATR